MNTNLKNWNGPFNLMDDVFQKLVLDQQMDAVETIKAMQNRTQFVQTIDLIPANLNVSLRHCYEEVKGNFLFCESIDLVEDKIQLHLPERLRIINPERIQFLESLISTNLAYTLLPYVGEYLFEFHMVTDIPNEREYFLGYHPFIFEAVMISPKSNLGFKSWDKIVNAFDFCSFVTKNEEEFFCDLPSPLQHCTLEDVHFVLQLFETSFRALPFVEEKDILRKRPFFEISTVKEDHWYGKGGYLL